MSAPTLQELIHQLQHGSNRLRLQAAHLLAGYPEPEAVAALREVLYTSEDPALQDTAAKSLGRMGVTAFDVLVELLSRPGATGHPRYTVRAIAAEALGKQQNHAAVQPLILALKDIHPEVRRQAASALIHYKEDRSIEALKQVLLQDPDPNVRSRAASVLQAMGITAPVNIPTIITASKPPTKPLPPLHSDRSPKKE